jgi:hypothetical protein
VVLRRKGQIAAFARPIRNLTLLLTASCGKAAREAGKGQRCDNESCLRPDPDVLQIRRWPELRDREDGRSWQRMGRLGSASEH